MNVWLVEPGIVAALIGFCGAVVGSVLTMLMSMRKTRIDQDRLNAEKQRLYHEIEKLRSETQEIRRRQTDTARQAIVDALKLFDRAVFDAPLYTEDPVEMFRAIRDTRINMQLTNAFYVRDEHIRDTFRALRKALLDIESEVLHKFPKLDELSYNSGDELTWGQRRERSRNVFGDQYYDCVRLMMSVRDPVMRHLSEIQMRLGIMERGDE